MASKGKGSGKSKAPARKSTRAADRAAANSAFPGLPAGASKVARAKRIERAQPPKETARQAAINRGAQVRMQARRPHTAVNLTGEGIVKGATFVRNHYVQHEAVQKTHAKLAALMKAMAEAESPQAEARYRASINPEIARLDAEIDYLGEQLRGAGLGEGYGKRSDQENKSQRAKLREELARLAARRRERYTSLYAAELRAVQAQYAKFAKVPRRRNRERAGKLAQSYLMEALRAQDEATTAAWRHWDSLPKPGGFSGEEYRNATAARARAWERVQDAVVAWAEAKGLKHERYK